LNQRSAVRWILLGVLAAVFAGPVANAQTDQHTDPLNLDPAVREAYQHFYNLDYDGALSRFQKIQAGHPQDPIAVDYVLLCVAFRELYHQDLLDTTLYAHDGFLTSKRVAVEDPAVRSQIESLTSQAVSLSDARIKSNSRDKDAYFARGYARAIHAAYIGMADHSFVSGLHQAVQAKSDCQKALQIDPQYADAKMIIGIQEFSVASLPGFLRFAAGMFGQGGSKDDGLKLLHECADKGTITPIEARTALTIFLRHDGRYQEALAVQHGLSEDYPHDYLFRLEEGNLTKDMGDGPKAITVYKAVIADAGKKNYFVDPRLQLAWFGLAETERGQNHLREAADAYLQTAAQPKCSDWLRKRAQLNAGEVLDLMHQRAQAVTQYRAAAQANDSAVSGPAKQYLKTAYAGK
jgi:tetratricopeptide (TPR) repeat protein